MDVLIVMPRLFLAKEIPIGQIQLISQGSFRKFVTISIVFATHLEVLCRVFKNSEVPVSWAKNTPPLNSTPGGVFYEEVFPNCGRGDREVVPLFLSIFPGQIEHPVADVTPTCLTTLVISTLREVSRTRYHTSGQPFTWGHLIFLSAHCNYASEICRFI